MSGAAPGGSAEPLLLPADEAAARLVSSSAEAYDYLAESILAWPDQTGLAALMHRAGWRGVGYKNLSGGIVAVHRATRPAGWARPVGSGRG